MLMMDWDEQDHHRHGEPRTNNHPIKDTTFNPTSSIMHFEADVEDEWAC